MVVQGEDQTVEPVKTAPVYTDFDPAPSDVLRARYDWLTGTTPDFSAEYALGNNGPSSRRSAVTAWRRLTSC
jgi:hypothetical protein